MGSLAADLTADALREHGNAYDHTRNTVMALLRAGETGHPGVLQVLGMGRGIYVRSVAADRGGDATASAEFDRFTADGVVKIIRDPEEKAGTGCHCQGATIALPGSWWSGEDGSTFNPPTLAKALIAEGHVVLGEGGRLYRYADGRYVDDGFEWVAGRVREELDQRYRENRLREVVSYCKATMPTPDAVAADRDYQRRQRPARLAGRRHPLP